MGSSAASSRLRSILRTTKACSSSQYRRFYSALSLLLQDIKRVKLAIRELSLKRCWRTRTRSSASNSAAPHLRRSSCLVFGEHYPSKPHQPRLQNQAKAQPMMVLDWAVAASPLHQHQPKRVSVWTQRAVACLQAGRRLPARNRGPERARGPGSRLEAGPSFEPIVSRTAVRARPQIGSRTGVGHHKKRRL